MTDGGAVPQVRMAHSRRSRAALGVGVHVPSAPQGLARRPWRLRFPAPLEDEFLEVYRKRGITLARFTVSAAFLLHWAAIVIDRSMLGHHLIEPLPALGMYALGLPMVTLYALLAFGARSGHALFIVAPYLIAANGVGISIALLYPQAEAGASLPHTLILLNPVFTLLLSGLLLRQALPTALFVVLFHLAVTVLVGFPVEVLAGDTLVISGSAVMCLMGGWQIERWHRAAWLREREFRNLADRDQLTGLASRHYLFQRGEPLMRDTLREGRALSVLMIDVDHFKEYNDRFGHGAGDDCLRRIAGVIREAAEAPDTIAARFGGEEFLMLLPRHGRERALTKAERLRARVAGIPGTDAPEAHRISVSIGIATVAGRDRPDLDTLISRADEALYRAKHAGRNRVVASD